MPNRTVLILALLATGAGCSRDNPTAPTTLGYGVVRISPTRLSYGAGSSVHLEIENVGPSVIATGTCPSRLERQVASGWEAVTNVNTNCDVLLLRIAPGVIGPGEVFLPATLATGIYRGRYDSMHAVNENVAVNVFALIGTQYTEPFAVTAAPSR